MTLDPAFFSTLLAWALVLPLAVICWIVIRAHKDIDWTASAAFVIATFLLAVSGAVLATSAFVTGDVASDPVRWFVIVTRALAATLFLGVAMDVTGRPRWVGRWLEKMARKT